MRRGALVAAVAVGLALIGTYVALGGTSFEPTAVADPCLERPERDDVGNAGVARAGGASGPPTRLPAGSACRARSSCSR